MLFNKRKTIAPNLSPSDLPFSLESLESRDMLSVVSVVASGDMGGEFFELEIAGESAGVFRTTQQLTEYRVTTPETVKAEQVRIIFSGDLYDPENGVDRNLNVDYITIDGRRFETEAANTFASGVWDPAVGAVVEGFLQTEKLVTNGFFAFGTYPDATYESTIIEIDASSSAGNGEILELQIRGEIVASYQLLDNPLTGGFDGPQKFTFEAEGTVTADDIRIIFSNDEIFERTIKGVTSTIDRNLTIDSITVAGQKYYTDSLAVYSTGVWDSDTSGIVPGFGKGKTLHSNGYFQYSTNTVATTTIVVDTSTANGDGERYDLQIAGVTVAQTVLSDNPFQAGYQGQRELVIEVPGEVQISDIRIVFTNDAVFEQTISGLVRTVDRNLRINSVTVNGITYLTDDDSVFSTGVWNEAVGGPQPGFGLGDTLHTNGYFQYGRG